MTSYTTLEVENFKGIREMKLEGLGMVNVFVGGNNVGKTSVLQALAIANNGLPFGMTKPVTTEDDEVPVNEINSLKLSKHIFGDAVCLNFNHTLYKLPIGASDNNHVFYKLPSNNERVQIALNSLPILNSFDKKISITKNVITSLKNSCSIDFYIKGHFKTQSFTEAKGSAIIHNLTDQEVLTEKFEQMNTNASFEVKNYISTEINNYHNVAKALWYEQIENGREKNVIELLKVVEQSLTDIVASKEDLFCGKSVKNGKRIPLSLMGDGFIKLLALACILPNVKNEVLFIDEIENGFHYSVQEDMWRMILTAAKDDGTQFFFTTHSYEVLESLNVVLQDMKEKGESLKVAPKEGDATSEPLDLACVFELEKSNDDVVTYTKYQGLALEGAIINGIEIRGRNNDKN